MKPNNSINNKQALEYAAITQHLSEEFLEKFSAWNMEYSSQERDLGAIGEAVNLWRKVKKVKAAVIDGVSTAGWREPLRLILFEVIAHCFLLIYDLDKMTEEVRPDLNRHKDENLAEQSLNRINRDVWPACGYSSCDVCKYVNGDQMRAMKRPTTIGDPPETATHYPPQSGGLDHESWCTCSNCRAASGGAPT